MKNKILIFLFLLLSAVCYSESAQKSWQEILVDNFFSKGSCVKYYNAPDDIYYYPKYSIKKINVDDDEIAIFIEGDEGNVTKKRFHYDENSFELDVFGNLIIKNK